MAIVVYVKYLVNGSPFSKCQDTAHSSIQMYVSSSIDGGAAFMFFHCLVLVQDVTAMAVKRETWVAGK